MPYSQAAHIEQIRRLPWAATALRGPEALLGLWVLESVTAGTGATHCHEILPVNQLNHGARIPQLPWYVLRES